MEYKRAFLQPDFQKYQNMEVQLRFKRCGLKYYSSQSKFLSSTWLQKFLLAAHLAHVFYKFLIVYKHMTEHVMHPLIFGQYNSISIAALCTSCTSSTYHLQSNPQTTLYNHRHFTISIWRSSLRPFFSSHIHRSYCHLTLCVKPPAKYFFQFQVAEHKLLNKLFFIERFYQIQKNAVFDYGRSRRRQYCTRENAKW